MDRKVASTARFEGSPPKETPRTDASREEGSYKRGQVTKFEYSKYKERK